MAAVAGNKRAHPTSDVDNPIAFEMLPKPGQTYSQWIQANFQKLLSHQNASDATPAYKEGSPIFWSQYVDWAIKNPIILRTTFTAYFNDSSAWIFKKFPLVKTLQDRVIANMIEIDLDPPDIGTAGVPGRLIHSKVSRREQRLVHRSQGFMKDWKHMKTPDGMNEWNAFVDAVTSNIWSAIILDALNEFRMQPSAYHLPEHVWSFQGLPTTPDQVFQRQQATWGVYNREPQAFANINAMVSRIFEQKRLTLDAWIMASGDAHRIGVMDDTNKYADKSGTSVALNTRRNGATVPSYHGLDINIVPLLEGTQYNDHDEWVLQSEIQVGSKAEFPAYGPDDDASKFRSRQRDIQFCSWTSNDWDTYRLADFLDHALEFVPPRAGYTFGESGVVNRELLLKLGEDSDMAYKRTATQKKGNERRLSVMLGHFPHADTFYPLEVFGEIDDAFCHTDEFPWAAETLQNAIFKDFTKDDIREFENGLEFVKKLKNGTKTGGLDAYGVDAMLGGAVRATADLFARDVQQDDPGYIGTWMLKPNKFGFVDVAVNVGAFGLHGMGHISAMMWLASRFDAGEDRGVSDEDRNTISRFVKLYERVVKNLKQCVPDHPAVDPRLVPLYHNSSEMNDFTRSMIVAWYTLFDSYTPPVVRAAAGAATAVTADKDTGDKTDNPFAKMPEKLVEEFQNFFGNGDTETPDLAATKKVAENISTLYSAFQTLQKLPTGTDAASKKRDKLLSSVENYTTPYLLKGAGPDKIVTAEKFLEWIGTGDNAANIESVLEARCRRGTAMGAVLQRTYETFRTLQTKTRTDAGADAPGPLTGRDLVIMPFVYTPAALADQNDWGHPIMVGIPDANNIYSGIRAHIVGKVDPTAGGCDSAFDPEDAYSYGGTLGTALPFVHPHYPFLPRSGNVGRQLMMHGTSGIAVGPNSRAVRYRDGFPATTAPSRQTMQYGYDEIQRRMYVHSPAFGEAQSAFPNLNRVMLQSIVAPFCGHPLKNDLTFFELRWVKSHDLGTMHGLAQRAYLLAPCRSSTFHGFDKCNVEILFGGDLFRPFEGQLMHSQIGLAEGPVGTEWTHGMDNMISFQPLSEKFVVMAQVRHKAMIERLDAFYIAEYTRGGIGVGGKGNRYINEGIQVWPNDNPYANSVHERIGISSLMGDHSLIACLAGYNHARKPFRTKNLDIRGNWKVADFVGKLHESHDFMVTRPVPMYDAQFITNYVYGGDFNYDPPRKRLGTMSFQDKESLRQTNYIVHQTTQLCNDGKKRIRSHHPWNEQEPGLVTREQGLEPTKLVT